LLSQISSARTHAEAVKSALALLIEFTYQKIAQKRRTQLSFMDRALYTGANDSKKFEEEIYNYFEAKYYDELYKSVYGPEAEISIEKIYKWLDDRLRSDPTGAYLDNVSHLRGSCNRLRVDQANNPVILVLSAFCILTNPALERRFGIDDYRNGWSLFISLLNLEQEQVQNYMRTFNERILQDYPDETLASDLEKEVQSLGLQRIVESFARLHGEVARFNQRIWGAH